MRTSPASPRVRKGVAGALGLAALVGGSVLAADPASATMTCTGRTDSNVCLTIDPAGSGFYHVHVGIDVHMSQQDAQAIIDAPGDPYSGTMYGEDTFSDDFLFTLPTPSIGAGPDGVSADFDLTVTRRDLNEDDTIGDREDDVFAVIRLYDARSGRSRVFRSNTIHQSF